MESPPPPPGYNGPPPAYNAPPPPPPGFAAYGGGTTPQKTNGMAVTSLVLSLVGLVPCFWLLQIAGLLGFIFGLVGRSQIKKSNGLQKGGGLAVAGIVIGAVLLALCVVIWIVFAVNGNCTRVGGSLSCDTNN
jgi:hypothetical protein